MLALKRRLYQLILSLHPAAFRDRFAREMSLDFEDTLATYGFSRLLADATRSLARQWTTAPAFTRNSTAAPIPLHPLLAGHYLAIDDNNLKPFELLRGTLLFAVMLFVLGLVLNHGGNYSDAGHLPGLPENKSAISANAGVGPFEPTTSQSSPGIYSHPSSHTHPDRSTRYILRADNKTGERGSLRGSPASPPPGTWPDFFLRCALVTLIVWLTSFLLRRSRTIGMRMALTALGLLGVTVSAAASPLHIPMAPKHFSRKDRGLHSRSQPSSHSRIRRATGIGPAPMKSISHPCLPAD